MEKCYELDQLPAIVRIARRNRLHSVDLEAETGLNSTTLRNAEAGHAVSLVTLQKIVNWTGANVVITPGNYQHVVPEEEGESE